MMAALPATLPPSAALSNPSLDGMLPISNPATGAISGSVPNQSRAEIAEAAARSRAAQAAWSEVSYRDRAKVIIRFHDLILKEREALFDVIQSESGKSRRDAFVELFAVACEARYYAYNGWRFIRPRRVKSAIPFRDRSRV